MSGSIPNVLLTRKGLVTDELEPQRKSDRITKNDDLFVIAHLGIPETPPRLDPGYLRTGRDAADIETRRSLGLPQAYRGNRS